MKTDKSKIITYVVMIGGGMFGIQANESDSENQASSNDDAHNNTGAMPANEPSNNDQHSSSPLNLPEPVGGQDNNQPAPPPATNDAPPLRSSMQGDNNPTEEGFPLANETDLLDIKQQALQQLSPLITHLDQTAEEKFKTTMMLMQATDNSELVRMAYEAAQAIEDEKVRAQALLDVVNEINYFTQKEQKQL